MTASKQLADALSLLYKRGHLSSLRQGRTFKCSRCGLSGLVGPDGKQLGELFKKDCGSPAGVSFDYDPKLDGAA